MAITQNTLIGASRKKIGGSVFSTWKGINVLKSKPLTVANPRTDLQLQRRSALTQAVEIFRNINNVINFGFIEKAVRQSSYNAFLSYMLKNAFNYDTPPNAVYLNENLRISDGTIGSQQVDVEVFLPSSLSLSWNTGNIPTGGSSNDTLIVAVQNKTRGTIEAYDTGATRGVGSFTVGLVNNYVSGDECFVSTGFVSKSRRKADVSITVIRDIE